jgi:hypothetical protein
MKEKQRQLREEVKELAAQAEAADRQEDRRYGDRRETRLARINPAKKVVEQRAREKAAAEGKHAEKAKKATPEDQDQYNFTDPESRIVKGAHGFVQGCNAQAAMEPETGLVVGQLVTQAANDREQLKPTVEAIEQQLGQRPEATLAGAG